MLTQIIDKWSDKDERLRRLFELSETANRFKAELAQLSENQIEQVAKTDDYKIYIEFMDKFDDMVTDARATTEVHFGLTEDEKAAMRRLLDEYYAES